MERDINNYIRPCRNQGTPFLLQGPSVKLCETVDIAAPSETSLRTVLPSGTTPLTTAHNVQV